MIPTTITILTSFGLRKDVTVSFIIRKPTFKKWITNIDFDEYFLVTRQLNTIFALKYIISNSGMPVNLKFDSKFFSELLS